MTIANKKASLAELTHLKDVIFKQLDFIRGNGTVGRDIIDMGSLENEGNQVSSKEFTDLSTRFEYLSGRLVDLQVKSDSMVARNEVQEAILALVQEVKYI